MILRVLRVSGHSMQPAFMEGDIVIVSSLFPIRPFDVVAFKYRNKTLLKRVTDIRSGAFRVVGDNVADSLDSKSFGDVIKRDIIGKVVFKF